MRWYSQHDCCVNLIDARYVIKCVREEFEMLAAIQTKAKVQQFLHTTRKPSFWRSTSELIGVLRQPSSVIGKMKKDRSNLFEVYNSFQSLMESWSKLKDLNETVRGKLTAIVQEC